MDKVISKYEDWSSTCVSFGTYCPKCCRPYYTVYPSTTDGGVCECADEIKSTPPKQGGWICPACGCGNASWSSKCGHCVPKFEGTTGSTEGVE